MSKFSGRSHEIFLYDLNLETSNIFKNKLKSEFSDNAEQYEKIINLIEKRDLFFLNR